MKGLRLDQYIKDFEHLAEQAALTLANPSITQAFIRGLTPSLQRDLTKTTYGYRTARAQAIKINWVDKLLVALLTKDLPCKQTREEEAAPEQLTKTPKVTEMDAPTSHQVWKNTQQLAQTYTPAGPPPKQQMTNEANNETEPSTIRTNGTDVYVSAQKSMMVRTYIHTSSKRAETITLLDSGATENFMNLGYAWWLQLPIKQLETP